MKQILIGIDPGTQTGFSIYDCQERRLTQVKSCSILNAIAFVRYYHIDREYQVHVVVEDARQVVHKTDRVKAQGAGSVKRDCSIWEEFLKSQKISHEFVRPNKKITKLTPGQFEQITGYQERSNQHGRDAAMLVYQRSFPKYRVV